MNKKSPGRLAPHLEAIRAAFAAGRTTTEVAREFGATYAAVLAIREGRHYADGSTTAWQRSETPPVAKPKPPPAPKPESKVDRAMRHWAKNPEMTVSEVAEMYGVKGDVLTARKKAVAR